MSEQLADRIAQSLREANLIFDQDAGNPASDVATMKAVSELIAPHLPAARDVWHMWIDVQIDYLQEIELTEYGKGRLSAFEEAKTRALQPPAARDAGPPAAAPPPTVHYIVGGKGFACGASAEDVVNCPACFSELSAHRAAAQPPDETKWKCACGWQGVPSQMTVSNELRTCPECGASGGLILAAQPVAPLHDVTCQRWTHPELECNCQPVAGPDEDCPVCGAHIVVGGDKMECAARCGWWIERAIAPVAGNDVPRQVAQDIVDRFCRLPWKAKLIRLREMIEVAFPALRGLSR